MCSKIERLPDKFAFDCPLHGYEIGFFCFRAFDTDNIDRWKRLSTTAYELRPEDKIKVLDIIDKERNNTESCPPSG